tara:strand:- start:631 stop:1833 length:1203 start_codon:yes stop_codon:yes gene_type:complete
MWDDEDKVGLVSQIQNIEKDLDEWMKGLPSKGRTDFSSGMYGLSAAPWSTAQNYNQLKEIKKKASDFKSLIMAGTILDDEGEDKYGNIISRNDLTPYGGKFLSKYKKQLLFDNNERSEEPLLDVKDIVKNIKGSQEGRGVRDFQDTGWALAGSDLNSRSNSKLKSAIQERLWLDLNPAERMDRLKNDKHLGVATYYDGHNIPYEVDHAEEMRIQDENENFMIERFAEKFPNEYLDFITNERESMQQYINETDPMGEGIGSWNERGQATTGFHEPSVVSGHLVSGYGKGKYGEDDRIGKSFYVPGPTEINEETGEEKPTRTIETERANYHQDLYKKWKKNKPVNTSDSTESKSNYDVEKAAMVLSPDMKQTLHTSLDELGRRREEILSGIQYTLSNLEGFM